MLRELRCAVEQVRRLVGALEPERFAGPDARAVAELFGELERLAGGGKALAARQVVATNAWRGVGAHRDAAAWLSSATGTTVGAARATLNASTKLTELPATEAAVRAGELSGVQMEAVAGAASIVPEVEAQLLESARHDGVRGLRIACDRVKAAASNDAAQRYERACEARAVRHWVDAEGAGRIDVRGPLDVTSKMMAALRPYERELFKAARRSGVRERPEALAFDALSRALAAPAGSRAKVQTEHVVRVDHAALVRGSVEPGEVCEIAGVGPIPVHVASRLLDDSFVKAVLVDGVDVLAVSHIGRSIPAHLRTALEELYQQCVIGGCEVREHLENDHNLPVEFHGPTALWNLGRLCGHHHEHKHRHNLRLVGEGTRQRFVPADDPEYLKNLRSLLC
ncbi:MAG TPA: hypothetical protein VGN51_12955 [Acidimicrobiia bacterium]|jgi:hypothetical protein